MTPIFEFSCGDCGHEFEYWVRRQEDEVLCPDCQGPRLERLVSLPRVHSEGRRDRSMRAAKRRDVAQSREMAHAQREYELNHDD